MSNALPPDRIGVWHRPLAERTGPLAPATDQPGMTVYWHGGRPVGHVLVMADGGKTSAEPPAEIPPLHVADPAPGRVSVVICTRDRPDDIAVCLASLPMQTRRPDEIVVVDNAPRDDRTRDAALNAGATYVREPRPGLDIARNTGVRAATGDLIVFTDDDVLLDPTWLERMTAAFDAPEIGSVTGLVLPAELAAESQFLFERYWSFNRGYARRDVTRAVFEGYTGRHMFPPWSLGAGASMAFRRAIFADAGYFDERLDAGQSGCSGDSEYWYRVLHHGWTCRYEPSAVAYHYHRRDMPGLVHQIRQYMSGHVSSVLVQYERTRRPGNLWHVLWHLPVFYGKRSVRHWLLRRRSDETRFLPQELSGYFAGWRFYFRTPRDRRG